MAFCGLALLVALIVNLNAGEDASLLLRDKKTLSSFILSLLYPEGLNLAGVAVLDEASA